jgi:hypothetical protein
MATIIVSIGLFECFSVSGLIWPFQFGWWRNTIKTNFIRDENCSAKNYENSHLKPPFFSSCHFSFKSPVSLKQILSESKFIVSSRGKKKHSNVQMKWKIIILGVSINDVAGLFSYSVKKIWKISKTPGLFFIQILHFFPIFLIFSSFYQHLYFFISV